MTLKRFVNDREEFQDFLSYVTEKIALRHKSLEQATELAEVYRLQGEIRALRKLASLRDEVNKG